MKRVYKTGNNEKKIKKLIDETEVRHHEIKKVDEETVWTSRGLSKIKYVKLEVKTKEINSKDWPFRFISLLRILDARYDDHFNDIERVKKRGLKRFLKGQIRDRGMSISELTNSLSDWEYLHSPLKSHYILPILKTLNESNLIKIYKENGRGNQKYCITEEGKLALKTIQDEKGPLTSFFNYFLSFRSNENLDTDTKVWKNI